MLNNWPILNPDPRPHLYSAHLTGEALTFHRSLRPAQKGSFGELRRLFRRQYKPNADVSKVQVKSLHQLPGQIVSSFYTALRDLADKAYTEAAVRNEIIFTTFIEGLAKSVVRWEVRKRKPATVHDAVVLANKMQSHLILHGQQPDTAPVASMNNLARLSTSQSEMLSDLVFTIKEEVKRVFDDRNSSPRKNRNTERSTSNRSYNPDGTHRNNQERNNNGNKGQRNWNNSRGNTPNRGNSQDPKPRVSFRSPRKGSSRK